MVIPAVVRQLNRGSADAADRPRGSRRPSPPDRWSSSRTRSESSTASSTSWVIMTMVVLSSCWICITVSWRWARVSASRAPKGSSSSNTFGFIASAWRYPPAASCRRRSPRDVCAAHDPICTRAPVFDPLPALPATHGATEHLIHRQRHIVETAQPRQQRVVLKLPPLRPGTGDFPVITQQSALGRGGDPAIRLAGSIFRNPSSRSG